MFAKQMGVFRRTDVMGNAKQLWKHYQTELEKLDKLKV